MAILRDAHWNTTHGLQLFASTRILSPVSNDCRLSTKVVLLRWPAKDRTYLLEAPFSELGGSCPLEGDVRSNQQFLEFEAKSEVYLSGLPAKFGFKRPISTVRACKVAAHWVTKGRRSPTCDPSMAPLIGIG